MLESFLMKACDMVTLRTKMQRLVNQRYIVKFCVKLNKSASETLGMINEAYRNKAMGLLSEVRFDRHKSVDFSTSWLKQFSSCCTGLEDLFTFRIPRTSAVELPFNVTNHCDRHRPFQKFLGWNWWSSMQAVSETTPGDWARPYTLHTPSL